MWMLLMSATLAAAVIGTIYLISRVMKFQAVDRIMGKRRWLKLIFAIAATAVLVLSLYFAFGIANTVILMIHIVVIWLFCDLAAFAVRKIRGRGCGIYLAGCAAILISIAYLSMGWYFAHHVYETHYEIETQKQLKEDIKLVLFADSHMGATFHYERFEEYMKKIEALEPDLVVLAGDFVDDDSTKEDMLKCAEALGELKTRYGVYFVYGNHDRGYYGPEYRGYSGDDVESALVDNGVVVLKDEAVLIDDSFYLIGRKDQSFGARETMDELIAGLDTDKYMIVADHQPHDYAAQEESGVDMVLSGHTHGGWFFPINHLSELTGVDDKVYGHEKRTNTDFIVTSGISEWAMKFRTGCIAEYVVIDIKNSEN